MKYYITYNKTIETHPNRTLLDILNGITNEITTGKKTIYIETTEEELLQKIQQKFSRCPLNPKEIAPKDIAYNTFMIPKKSGGYRTINAPKEKLMQLLTDYRYQLENTNILVHDAAHAYVKGRSTLTALKEHQKNESKYFLKIDFQDFFGSFTKERILEQLKQIYPFCGILLRNEAEVSTMLDHCLKDGVLPQGTPVSPLLTNICMVPIDTKIAATCKKAGYIYTRYADDILISSKQPFKFYDLVKFIDEKLTPEWLRINPNKTRYGSNGGKNWNLGLMLNKDNKITIGHKKKEILKATIHHALTDHLSAQEKMEIQGYIAYAYQIEPDYVTAIIRRLEEKTQQNLRQCLK